MQLHDVTEGIAPHKKRKRIGRGKGSGHGKTATKGHKGHSSRQGFKSPTLHEGGTTRLFMRTPKRGFTNGPFKDDFAIVNVAELEAFPAGAEVNEATLRAAGLVKGRHDAGVKILGHGALTKALKVEADRFSASAVTKIEAAGGSVQTIATPYRGG
jgi:large subunit ribosomal protein L15